jgi:trans-4-hydroxy-L-proline dehydratase
MAPITPRIERLRAHALDQSAAPLPEEPALLHARAWLAAAGELWTVMRRARATAGILEGLTPVIDPDELLVGKYCRRALTSAEADELCRFRESAAPAMPPVRGQTAHMAIDFDVLLQLGVSGLREQIAGYRARLDLVRPEDLEMDAFYRACLLALEALAAYSCRYADLAASQAMLEPDAHRRAELREIAAVCCQVPEFPARTFREALQSAHFVTYSLCAGQRTVLFQLGRPDRYLLPYYRRDLAAGRLTSEAALELIDCLGLMLCEYTPRGLAVGWMLGGRDASGADVCNELTELFLESIGHVRMSYPAPGLCWTPDTPQPIMDRVGRLLADGLSHPALFNDDVITAGLMRAGLPRGEACLYQHSACVEITPIGSSNVYVASPYVNLVQLLNDELGVPSADSQAQAAIPGAARLPVPHVFSGSKADSHPATFEALLAAYRARLSEAIRLAVMDQNTLQATRRYNGGAPLLSCFVNDCLARGLDIDHGGARYNWIEPSFVGLSNLVDALAAIRVFVYEERRLSMGELVQALAGNFSGREDLRLMLLHRAPKYGNDDDGVDALVVEVTSWIRDEMRRYTTYLGGRFVSGFFCWVMHERLGRLTCASADGRRAGFPLGDGSGPAQGRERAGPTAALLSATRWDHTPHLGGIAVNLKFPRSHDRTFAEKLIDLVSTYLERGGFEVQVNVVDKATLVAAREHPESHRDLVVRIGGYSDYFVGLSPEMQEEIILRTEHDM